MGWGFMMGLGQGLTQAGGMISDNAKMKLADKLEQDKEKRANERDDMKYQRDQLAFDHSEFEMRDGALYKVDYNKAGHEVESKLAPQDAVDKHNFETQKDKVTLEALMANTDLTKKKAANYDEDHALEQAYTRSQINYNNDRGLAATMRASGSGQSSTMTPQEGASYLIKQYPTVVTSARNAGVQEWEIQKLAASVMKEASSPEDAKSRFADTLKILMRNKKAAAEE